MNMLEGDHVTICMLVRIHAGGRDWIVSVDCDITPSLRVIILMTQRVLLAEGVLGHFLVGHFQAFQYVAKFCGVRDEVGIIVKLLIVRGLERQGVKQLMEIRGPFSASGWCLWKSLIFPCALARLVAGSQVL